MIRRATNADIDAVEAGYTELLTFEEKNGSFSNWQRGVYPVRATAEKALASGTLYVLEENGQICASVILNHVPPCEHEKIAWRYPVPDCEALTVHTLCVPPEHAGKGCGKRMMAFALTLARDTGCKVVRLDTYEGNIPAQSLYTKLGFSKAGSAEVVLEGVLAERLLYFEYSLVHS
ncbi:MAG: GNAT family N-acetyltransferase [Eubacteriales bacterium]